MERNITKILIIVGWVVIIVGAICNIDTTMDLNKTQYVPEGESPTPIRITEILQDILYPVRDGFMLIGLAYFIRFFQASKPPRSE